MKKVLPFLFLMLPALTAGAQTRGIVPIINAWKTTDLSQTGKCRELVRYFFEHAITPGQKQSYYKEIALLKQYVRDHPDPRLKVRLMIYEFHIRLDSSFKRDFFDEAINLAYPLKDDQLNAELYLLRGSHPLSPDTRLFYNLKGIELQQKIGIRYFPYGYVPYYEVSRCLYDLGDYRKAIDYGRQFMAIYHATGSQLLPDHYVFQCDILGASFKNLNQFDSARAYYKRILQMPRPKMTNLDSTLWSGIAKGSIGQTYTQEGKYTLALPLLMNYLQAAHQLNDRLNIAMAQNAFANYYLRQGQYNKALRAARLAYDTASKYTLLPQLRDAAQYISLIDRHSNHIHEAFYYYDLYHSYKDAIREQNKKGAFSVIQAQLAFDKLQHSLAISQSVALQQRQKQQLILISISLLLVITGLLYNRKRLKDRAKLEKIAADYQNAQAEIDQARERIRFFTRLIVEKNNLIQGMEAQNRWQTPPAELQIQLLCNAIITETEWEKFREEFTKAFPHFFLRMHQNAPNITPAMERLAALIFLGLNNYQIANTLGISKDSVTRSKHRLRHLLYLSHEKTLEEYLFDL
ncbi:tetratricopeptide repeat protein [Niabella hirudinis]|uniref:tetratricopeptide repeat protein n=1 Tax=Niabella hirudinis TaxID=1285929 RepID=UPI003EBBA9B1